MTVSRGLASTGYASPPVYDDVLSICYDILNKYVFKKSQNGR